VNKKTTKCKILECAKSLFCKHGIDGTSIRDIAKNADVNLSAINYHFKSKENLYKEIFTTEYIQLSNEIEKLLDNSKSIIDLSSLTFNLLKKNGKSLLFIFHSFLNLDLDPKLFYNEDIREFGPIGTKTFLKQLDLDLGAKESEISIEKKIWLVRSLLAMIIHIAISLQSPFLKKLDENTSILGSSHQNDSIENLAKALFNSI